MWRHAGYPVAEAERIDGTLTNFTSPAAEAPENLCQREPVKPKDPRRKGMRIAEVVGGKTAECAAILCCCPCGIANLFILATVRFPAGLCRKALRKRIMIRRAKKAAGLLGSGSDGGSGSGSSKEGSPADDELAEFSSVRGRGMMVVVDRWPARSPTAEVIELEKEVWSKFYSSGFWRSLSQKDSH
ncbi:hypothetical protein KSP40_PGU018802 [Platanthera guangdongensis]|uniref:Uncharacterized protein n=1 Tax=Platanthera guangdongensis TaxID=2320717 RepID=A0ABR2ME70_9ASPA